MSRQVRHRRRRTEPKRLPPQGLLGQQGVNLIERIVLDMGSRWIPGGPNEVGIDGFVELFEPGTGSSLGAIIGVQSKAVSRFDAETDDAFSFRCERRDIQYWLEGNIPIVLVVSRPSTAEAYWVAVKDYFQKDIDASPTVHFNKATQRFTKHAVSQLARLGLPREVGLYLPPNPRPEELYSNLLELTDYPKTIYVAATECRRPSHVWHAIEEAKARVGGSWVLRDKSILSFEDLTEPCWADVCEPGSVDTLDVDDWLGYEDEDHRNTFVDLLNETLRDQLWPHIRYWRNEDCFAFAGDVERGEKKLSYRSARRKSKITVVSHHKRTLPDGRTFHRLRHLGFRSRFRCFEDMWYLEITPTYRFTYNGLYLDRYHEDLLRGIKRIEGNRAVLSSVLFFADYLSTKADLFANRRRLLTFGRLRSFALDAGIDDSMWRQSDPSPPRDVAAARQELLLPFMVQPEAEQ